MRNCHVLKSWRHGAHDLFSQASRPKKSADRYQHSMSTSTPSYWDRTSILPTSSGGVVILDSSFGSYVCSDLCGRVHSRFSQLKTEPSLCTQTDVTLETSSYRERPTPLRPLIFTLISYTQLMMQNSPARSTMLRSPRRHMQTSCVAHHIFPSTTNALRLFTFLWVKRCALEDSGPARNLLLASIVQQ